LIDYWDKEVLTQQMREHISQNDRVMMYMDSLELATKGKGGLFWGYYAVSPAKLAPRQWNAVKGRNILWYAF